MHTPLKTLLATLLITTASHAVAASSVDLTVRGLITPSACEPTLSNGGQYDIGKISAKDLNANSMTDLPEHTLQLTVTCDAATLMAIEPQDNRPGSAFLDAPTVFGLGLINTTEKLGNLEMWLRNPLADGVAGRAINSVDGGLTWAQNTMFARSSLTSVADATTVAPVPVQVFTSDMVVAPSIAPASGLTLNNEVAIDGSVTLTVKYL